MASSISARPDPTTSSPSSPGEPDPTATVTSTTAATTTVATSLPSTSGGEQPTHPCLAGLAAADRAALLVWPAVYPEQWDVARTTVREHGVGGVLLMNVRDATAAELTERLAELRTLAPHGLVVATDEEGGEVQRLRSLRPLPSQSEISATLTVDEARMLVAEHGAFIAALGIDVVLGPMVDVLPADGPPPLQRSRFFVGDADEVARYGAAYVAGWNDAGLSATLKHFPGHGSASADTHLGAAATPPLESLIRRDLVPYREILGSMTAPVAVMVGHVVVPGLTEGLPATLSSRAVDHLRTEIGAADALVISDALDMAAIELPVPEAAVAAIAAGVDVVLVTDPRETGPIIAAVTEAVAAGVIPQERIDDAVGRVLEHQRREPACR